MILLICNDFSIIEGRLEQFALALRKIIRIKIFRVKVTDSGAYCFYHKKSESGAIRFNYKKLVKLVRIASKILIQVQPSEFDLIYPYKRYIPLVYSFFKLSPSVKSKTFLVSPFYYSPDKNKVCKVLLNLEKEVLHKVRLGDFKVVPSERFFMPYSYESNAPQVLKLYSALYKFLIK